MWIEVAFEKNQPEHLTNLLLRRRISPRAKDFPRPATSEGPNTLSTAALRKDIGTQQSTPSRYEVCEMSGLALLVRLGGWNHVWIWRPRSCGQHFAGVRSGS